MIADGTHKEPRADGEAAPVLFDG